jgi:fructan beta-fructosidase
VRPGYHYTPARNWLNDPNGLVWYDGEYHLFYQHNPHGTDWGNMSWGHAVSPDLFAWTELPVALAHTDAEHVYSGSVVVDHRDTSGFGVDGHPAMVAVYTSHDPISGRQTQALAHSLDRGRTWTRYAGNPVLDIGATDFRDPKVFWYEPGGYWVMVVVLALDHVVRFYRSADLRSWHHLSDFGPAGAVAGPWECPDLFELPVDDDPAHTRWVLVVSVAAGAVTGGSGVQYFVGDFDGELFVADDPAAYSWLDHGADYYAAVSFTDDPAGERVLIGWMNNWAYANDVPATASRGTMSVPRRHELATIDGRVRLVQRPVRQATWPSDPGLVLENTAVAPGVTPLPDAVRGGRLEIRVSFRPQRAERLGLHVRAGADERTVVGYDVRRASLYVDRTESGRVAFHPVFPGVHSAPLPVRDGLVSMTVLVDSTSVEVFAGSGEVVITDQVFPDPGSVGLALFAEGGSATVVDLAVTVLSSLDDSPAAEREIEASQLHA